MKRFLSASMLAVQVFLYLQVLDFLTTLIGFKLGASEASPFIANVIHHAGPTVGLALAKMGGVGIGYLCIVSKRGHLIRWINYWYAGLVVWNLGIIFLVAQHLPIAHA